MGMEPSAGDWLVYAVFMAIIALLLFLGYRDRR